MYISLQKSTPAGPNGVSTTVPSLPAARLFIVTARFLTDGETHEYTPPTIEGMYSPPIAKICLSIVAI